MRRFQQLALIIDLSRDKLWMLIKNSSSHVPKLPILLDNNNNNFIINCNPLKFKMRVKEVCFQQSSMNN